MNQNGKNNNQRSDVVLSLNIQRISAIYSLVADVSFVSSGKQHVECNINFVISNGKEFSVDNKYFMYCPIVMGEKFWKFCVQLPFVVSW